VISRDQYSTEEHERKHHRKEKRIARMAGGSVSLRPRDILEHVFERLVEHLGNPKGHLQRWPVLAALDGVHRLTGYTDLIGQFLLRHFLLVEPKCSDLIVKFGL